MREKTFGCARINYKLRRKNQQLDVFTLTKRKTLIGRQPANVIYLEIKLFDLITRKNIHIEEII